MHFGLQEHNILINSVGLYKRGGRGGGAWTINSPLDALFIKPEKLPEIIPYKSLAADCLFLIEGDKKRVIKC